MSSVLPSEGGVEVSGGLGVEASGISKAEKINKMISVFERILKVDADQFDDEQLKELNVAVTLILSETASDQGDENA